MDAPHDYKVFLGVATGMATMVAFVAFTRNISLSEALDVCAEERLRPAEDDAREMKWSFPDG